MNDDPGEHAVETELNRHFELVDAIVVRTDDYDLTIVGATQDGLRQKLVFGILPEAVGQRARNPVIMTKRDLGITSQLKRWLRWG